MAEFLQWMETAVTTVNSYLSDYILIILLVGVGIFFTFRTKFVQVRFFGKGLKKVFGGIKLNGGKQKSGMSSFQAFATAVAGQVGTGNIIGACGAIILGGPGAIFWMWIIAFLGMATIYAEAVLAQKTKKVNADGTVSGGPVYYIRQAFKGKFGKFLAGFFAVAVIISLGFVGAMVQSNAISSAVTNFVGSVGVENSENWSWIIGIVLAMVTGIIIIGGAKRIASVTEKVVPIMAVIYILGGLIILGFKITAIPEALWMILKFAFTPNAIIGGSIGYALKKTISMGAQRGLFSNEAGMGSTPHAHAQADVKTAHEQGLSAMISVFLDTFIVITITALIVITTLYAGGGVMTQLPTASDGIKDVNMVQTAISTLFSDVNVGSIVGATFVVICLTFFAFSTIISWNLFGKINFEYLFGKKFAIIYSIISLIFIILGSLFSNGLVWELSNFFNYLMVLPNVIALIALSKIVVDEVKGNTKKKSVGDTPNQPLNDEIVSK